MSTFTVRSIYKELKIGANSCLSGLNGDTAVEEDGSGVGKDAPKPSQRRHTEPLQLRERAPRTPLCHEGLRNLGLCFGFGVIIDGTTAVLTGEEGAEADDGDAAVSRGDGGEVGSGGQFGEGAGLAGGGGRGRRHEAVTAADGRLRGHRRRR